MPTVYIDTNSADRPKDAELILANFAHTMTLSNTCIIKYGPKNGLWEVKKQLGIHPKTKLWTGCDAMRDDIQEILALYPDAFKPNWGRGRLL